MELEKVRIIDGHPHPEWEEPEFYYVVYNKELGIYLEDLPLLAEWVEGVPDEIKDVIDIQTECDTIIVNRRAVREVLDLLNDAYSYYVRKQLKKQKEV